MSTCLDFVLKFIAKMHKVYQKSTWGASAIETDRVVWKLSLECNFVQAASDSLYTRLITFLQNFKTYTLYKVASSRLANYSILKTFDQKSQYTNIKFPLHNHSENAWVC